MKAFNEPRTVDGQRIHISTIERRGRFWARWLHCKAGHTMVSAGRDNHHDGSSTDRFHCPGCGEIADRCN